MKKFITRLLTRNLWAKVLCLLMAFVLWIWVVSSQNTVAKFPGSLPIKAINTPVNLVAIYDTKDVKVKILAEPAIWQQLSIETFSVEINLSGLSEGTHQVPVNITSSLLGVQIVEQNPVSILVTLEPVITKTVKVAEQIEGTAANGLVPGDISFEPESVQIRGAKSVVDDIADAVATVSLNGQSADFSALVKPRVIDGKNQPIGGVTISPAEIKALISIVRGSNTKTVGVKVSVSGVPKDNYYISNITSTPGAVDISGVRSTVFATDYLSTLPVDVSSATADIVKDVALSVPNGVTILNNNSTKIHVTITISPLLISKNFNLNNFKVSAGNYKIISTDPASIGVSCSGLIGQINSLASSDFTILLDLSGQQPDSNGIISVNLTPANIQAPNGITVSSVVTTTIKVKVQ